MRKIYCILLLCTLSSVMLAQLKVADNGNVGIGIGTNIPLSNLSIGDVGDSNSRVYVIGNTIGLQSVTNSSIAYLGSWNYGILGKALFNSSMHVGSRGEAFHTTSVSSGRSWGTLGLAGNATSGYNYGVMGLVMGTNYGAGIVGVGSGSADVNIYDGLYAGYFAGDVKVTGLINGITVGNSDIRYKRNVVSLENAESATLSGIMQMNPVEYNLEQVFIESAGDSAKVKQGLYDEKSPLFQKKHYGLIAQELQKLYPDLVYENDNGYLSINYTGLIPVLIQAIKELKGEIDLLQTSAPIKQGTPPVENKTTFEQDISIPASLYQNSPNPFSQSTVIKYSLPQEVNQALLCIYDMNGRQIKQIALSERGGGSVTINGSELTAGIYLYALIADGKEVDVKRMILTE